jgi:hypothetical protein
MKSSKPRYRLSLRLAAFLLAALASLLLPSLPAAASPFTKFLATPAALRPGLDVLVGLNLDSSSETMNLMTSGLSCGLEYPLGSGFSFEPSLDAYWGYYELSASSRAVPTEISDRDVYAFGLLLDLPIVYTLRLGADFSLSGGLGLCFEPRVGIKAAKDVEDSTVASINAYFWSDGRFFMPSSLLRAEYRLNDKMSIGLGSTFHWPIYNLWAGEDLSFFDQSLIDSSLSIRYRLR